MSPRSSSHHPQPQTTNSFPPPQLHTYPITSNPSNPLTPPPHPHLYPPPNPNPPSQSCLKTTSPLKSHAHRSPAHPRSNTQSHIPTNPHRRHHTLLQQLAITPTLPIPPPKSRNELIHTSPNNPDIIMLYLPLSIYTHREQRSKGLNFEIVVSGLPVGFVYPYPMLWGDGLLTLM